MKFIFIFVLCFSINSFGQNIVGYVFSAEDKSTPFPLGLNPFATDGCTKYKDGTPDNPNLWLHCCVQHDATYWLGGTEEERKTSDLALQKCVAETGETGTAKIMYLGTRAGGGPLGQNTYRWGFGWNRVRDYKVLTQREKQMAYDMYGENLELLQKDIKENKFPVTVPDSYAYVSPFKYTFCEEEIINYLAPVLTKQATVTKFVDFGRGSEYTISIGLDICSEKIEFRFNRDTDSRTCKKDYGYHKYINKFDDVQISNKCLKRIREL